jgi:hypothetical protein
MTETEVTVEVLSCSEAFGILVENGKESKKAWEAILASLEHLPSWETQYKGHVIYIWLESHAWWTVVIRKDGSWKRVRACLAKGALRNAARLCRGWLSFTFSGEWDAPSV